MPIKLIFHAISLRGFLVFCQRCTVKNILCFELFTKRLVIYHVPVAVAELHCAKWLYNAEVFSWRHPCVACGTVPDDATHVGDGFNRFMDKFEINCKREGTHRDD